MSSPDRQLEEITEVILSYARLDFTPVPVVQGHGPLDAVAAGLQMLGAELQSAGAFRRVTETGDSVRSDLVSSLESRLRGPVADIILQTETMLAGGATREQLERVLREATRLQRALDDLAKAGDP